MTKGARYYNYILKHYSIINYLVIIYIELCRGTIKIDRLYDGMASHTLLNCMNLSFIHDTCLIEQELIDPKHVFDTIYVTSYLMDSYFINLNNSLVMK